MKSKRIVLDALRKWNKPYSPSLRELCEATGYCRAYVYLTVCALEEDGLVKKIPGAPRTITLTEKAITYPIYTNGDDMVGADGEVIHFMQLSPEPAETLPDAVEGSDNVIHFNAGVEIPTLHLVWSDDDPEDVATGIVK